MHNIVKGDLLTNEYMKNFYKLIEELQLVREPRDKGSTIFTFLCGIGPKYALFTISITTNLGQLTFDNIVVSLKTHNAMQSFYQQPSTKAT